MPQADTPRQPITELAQGVATRIGEHVLLSSRKLPIGLELAQGHLHIRYGITYLGRPQLSIVPELVIADYGVLLNGEDAWQFLMEKSHLYPRADVVGWRSDGQDDMPALKQLDFDYAFDVFLYADQADRQPLAQLNALIAADRVKFPLRLTARLPIYASLDEWRAR